MITNYNKSFLRIKSSVDKFEDMKTFSEVNRSNKMLNSNGYLYVKIKDLNEIKETYQHKGFFKVLSKSCGFFMKQAWHDFKADYQTFKQIKSIP